VNEAIATRTETVEGCPKYCQSCGNQGLCIDSRRGLGAVTRRYKCTCGRRWSTVELMMEEDGKAQRGKLQRYRDNERRKAIAGLRKDLDAVITRFFDGPEHG
jgi:transcriptional regulator NrdR family protein